MTEFFDHNGLFRQLQHHFNNDDESAMRLTLTDDFNSNENEAFSIALTIATKARFIFKTNRKSITEVALTELQEFVSTKKHLQPTKQNKDDAMFFLASYGTIHLEILKEIFQLDRGPDRGFLAKHLKYVIEVKNDLKEAALIATSLNLQEYIQPIEILLPLFVSDKFQVAEAYLANNTKEQKRYADMLNTLCGMTEERLLQYIQCDLQLRIVDRTKLKPKTLQKISERVVKKYQLDPADYPNIFKEKNLRSLKHLLVCKYRSPEQESDKWDGLIEAAVSGNHWLQEQLVFMLTYQYRDLDCAIHFAKKCNIPESSLPPSLQNAIKTMPLSSFQPRSKPKARSRYSNPRLSDDDDDDHGFMFASDDVDLDDDDYDDGCNGFGDSINVKAVPSNRFWDFALPKGNIRFINTLQGLEESMKVIFKHGNIIGFDGEWQPKYGRAGQRDKMAIMQLAVKETVFIIDILQFDKTTDGQNLLKKLFKLLFTSEDTVRLGYGIDSDISVITNTYEYTNEFFKKSKNFDDLAYISKQILSSPMVIDKLELEAKQTQNERGLSQLVKQCLGKPLDKTYQVSNWEQRPLSDEQMKYAALDALCLIKIYDVFEELAAEFHINVEMNEKDWQDEYSDQDNDKFYSTKSSELSGPVKRPGELAVVCDTMLQGLGKSLRFCGVDTKILQNENAHVQAIELCNEENRIILTKGRPFYQLRSKVPKHMCMCVPDGKTEYQVWLIFQRYNIRATSQDIFSRCQMCNCNQYVELDREKMMIAFWKKKGIKPKQLKLSPFQVKQIIQENNDPQIDYRYVTINKCVNLQCEFIPQPVFENIELFFCCGRCGKVYWQGSHYEKVHKQFSRVIDNTEEDWGQEIQDVDEDL